jgi:hypothetical protein
MSISLLPKEQYGRELLLSRSKQSATANVMCVTFHTNIPQTQTYRYDKS